MFNGYNETSLISSYNDFNQERENREENGGKWSYGPNQFHQHHSNNRQPEFWPPRPNLIGIPNVGNIAPKCNCPRCYSSPENQSYQGDPTRHRPWLPRMFPIPLNGSNEPCMLPPGYHQWNNVNNSSQGPCFSEPNPLPPQYLQENGGKPPYYRPYQNQRSSEPDPSSVIAPVKNTECMRENSLISNREGSQANPRPQEMIFFGQNGTKQQMFCNPNYNPNLTRNMEKRIDNRSCSSNYGEPSEKYPVLDSCRHSSSVASYGLEQHVSRLPMVEPYMKTVPSNVNRSRVSSTEHRRLEENKSQPYIDQSYCDARKNIRFEENQALNGNIRPVYPPPVVREGTACENFQSGHLHNIPPPMPMDLKSGGAHIDYSPFNANRDFSRSCANISESETQKFVFENNRHSEYFSRNTVSDAIIRNDQVPLLDGKDCAIPQIGQMNMPEQHCGNLPRSNNISNMSKYLELGNSKSSCGVYYPKDYNGDKISKSDKFEQMPENPMMTFQRSEDGSKNDNLNVHASIPRPALVFNDPRDARFADRAQNTYSYQNNTILYQSYIRSEYSYQEYNSQGSYEHPPFPHGVGGFQRNDPNQYNLRMISQQQQPPVLDQFLSHINNSLPYDPHVQQSSNSEKIFPQQISDKSHSPASSIPVASPALDHQPADVRLDLPLEVIKPSCIEILRAEDTNKNGSSKMSPLRLWRIKKFVNQKTETVVETIQRSTTPTDARPIIDVRKFWSTWADEDEENIQSQIVVLDCQNIDPEQAKFFHFDENIRTMRVENLGLFAVKGFSYDTDWSTYLTQFSGEFQEVNTAYSQVSFLNEVSPIIGKQNGVEITLLEDRPTVGKSFEGNAEVETLDISHEMMGSSEAGEINLPSERPVESVDQKTETTSSKNDGKPCKRRRSRASQENKESYRSKKVSLKKKKENVNRLDKWTEKKFDFLKRAEESKAAEILRHQEEKKKIFERRLSLQQGNITSEVKKISSNSKTPIGKEKLEMVNKDSKSSFENPDFEKKGVNEIFKSLSPVDDNSVSNSSEDSKSDLPRLPTSEYRRNKFLDYSEKRLSSNNSLPNSLGNPKGFNLRGNGEDTVKEDTNAKGNEMRVPSVSESKEIIKEKLIKLKRLTNNNWQSSEKLGNNVFRSSLDEIDNIKLRGEPGLHTLIMEDILKKMLEINFQKQEVRSESMNGITNGLRSEVTVEKATKPNKKSKKAKKLERQEESFERTEKLTVENIPMPKPMVQFSIQKSHDLKMSLKVLNTSKVQEKCETDEVAAREVVGRKNDSVEEAKNSTGPITLKLKSVQRESSHCERSHKPSKNGTWKKNRRRLRKKKARGEELCPLKTPVLKIKKSRYLLEKERDSVEEDTDSEKFSNASRKPSSDEYSNSADFQVQETIDSSKIKLTFKRHRTNLETQYKIDNNNEDEDDNNNNNNNNDDDDDEDDNNNNNNNNNDDDDDEEEEEDLQGDFDSQNKLKPFEFLDVCPKVTKTRFKKKSKKSRHEETSDEESVISFECVDVDAKETSEPNVDSDVEIIPNEDKLKPVPEEGSVNSASLQDLFGEDENYNFNEEEEEEEEPESTSRISPRVLSDLSLITPSFTPDDHVQTHGNYEESEYPALSFPSVNSNWGNSLNENGVENISVGSESLIEIDVDFLARSKAEIKENSHWGENQTKDDNNKKEVRLTEVNITDDENCGEEDRTREKSLGSTADNPEDDETLQEYPSGPVGIGGAVKCLISTVGNSGKEANFEGEDINNDDASLISVRLYSNENENKSTNFESDKNDSNTLISRDDDSFECEDLENDINGMNYGEDVPEASDDNNNNSEDNAKQLICSGQNYEDDKFNELESSESSTNQVNHSKNQSSYQSMLDKTDEQVVKTYPTDSALNYYCGNEKAGEESRVEVVDSVKDAEGLSGKVDDWKNYSNKLISEDDLNYNLSNSFELEGSRLFDEVSGLLTAGKNFNMEDIEMGSRCSLNVDKFSLGDNSISLGFLDVSESQNTKSEDSKPNDEVFNEADQDSREEEENETKVSTEENDEQEMTKSPLEVESSIENDSRSVDKVDESGIGSHNECLNEEEKVIADQADEPATIETLDFYSSPLSPKSINLSEYNSRLGDDDSASDLKQISTGEIDREKKDPLEVSDPFKEGIDCSAVKSSLLEDTIFMELACDRGQRGESSAYGDGVVDFISEFSDNRKSSDALEENENVSNEAPEIHSNDDELEEGEIVEEDSAGCSEEMLPEDVFVGMTTKPNTLDLTNFEGFGAKNIDSPRMEPETTVDSLRQDSEESNKKHESVDIPLDVNLGTDCKMKNSFPYFLEEIKFDKSKIRRRYSLKAETLGKFKPGKSERSTESQKFKFNKKMSLREKRSNRYNFKAKSCPPSFKFFNASQVQIPVLDIPIEDIPLPPGEPPQESCFSFEEYFEKYKDYEPKDSGSNLDLEMYKPPVESKEDRISPVISFNFCSDNAESFTEELNPVISQQPIPLKETKFPYIPSFDICKSLLMLSDFKSCQNFSPPSFKEKHHIPTTLDPVESFKNDLEPEELVKSSEMLDFLSKEIKMEDLITKKSEEFDWSPLKHNEGWQMDDFNQRNMGSSVVLESPAQLVHKANTTQLSFHESIPLTQGIYEDITTSSVELDNNFEDENLKTQTFSFPSFLNTEGEITTANNNRVSDEINGAEEKDLKEQEEMEITDNTPEKNEKANESKVTDDKNCTASEMKDEVAVKTLNAETGEIQNDYAINASPLKLMCEDVDIEEMQLRDLGPKTVDMIDDDSLNVLGFENVDYIRNEFYQCEDIPTSEDLPNGDQNEDDKVSDDDKFRNIMQNCLDNAKKFLNEGNLKLFSGSVEDLLELDCPMVGENDAEKSTSNSAQHISRDVLLTACEETVTDDLVLSQKFQPEDLSLDFVPSFSADGTNNLCPEILPVDNWPYLEEEVPLSPIKAKQDETEALPFAKNIAGKENNIPGNIDAAKSPDTILPVVDNGSFCAKMETLSGTKENTAKPRRMTFPGLEDGSFKCFRQKSLSTESDTFKKGSNITAQRRKTIEGFTPEPSVEAILNGSGVVSERETESNKATNSWLGGKSLKCCLSLEKLRSAEPFQGKYKSLFNISQELESESNKITTFSKDVETLNDKESSQKSARTQPVSLKRKSFSKYKTSSWQPKVMLYRISPKELKRMRRKCKQESQSVEEKINFKRSSHVDSSKEKAILEDDFKSREVDGSYSKPAFKKRRPNSESCEIEQDTDLPEKPKYVKSNSKSRCKDRDGKVEGQRINSNDKSSASALSKSAFRSHKSEKSTKHLEKEHHRGLEGSCKPLEIESSEEKLNPPVQNTVGDKKHKKSRRRNSHSSKNIEPHSNLNPLAKDISSPAQNTLPLDDPKLVDTERVLSEIFGDCDLPQAEIINCPKKSTKGLLSNSKSEDLESVKRKLTAYKDETIPSDKKAKTSSSPKNIEEHSARVSSKSIHSKHSHSSSVSEKTVKTESDKEHSHLSNKHSRESSKRRRSESIHSHKEEKKEVSEKGYSKHEERKEEKSESRERHKSESERHSRHERKREKHVGTKDRKKEGSRHRKRESRTVSPSVKSQNKSKHSEGKNSKSFVQKGDENRPKGSPEVEYNEKYEPMEPDLDSSWVCEVCSFDDASERFEHIKTHPFHCQSCYLAFKTESYFISHLTKEHKDIRNQHHCLLCELSFDTEEQYQRHLETREHRHLESVEKNTINTLFTLLTGEPCPVLGIVNVKPEWLPNQAGTVHFYHQATPLSLALQYLKMHHELSPPSTVASAHLN